MDYNERDVVIRSKILGEIADIESFVSGVTQFEFSKSKLAQKQWS